MRRCPKLECPFLGCTGEIDLVAQVRQAILFSTGKRIPRTVAIEWSITTIICPKCNNAVAELNIYPDTWVSPEAKRTKGKPTGIDDCKHSIFRAKDHKIIPVKSGQKALNPYLKKWARFEPVRKKRSHTDRRGVLS